MLFVLTGREGGARQSSPLVLCQNRTTPGGAMNNIHVACGQFETKPGDKGYNIGRIQDQASEAAERGCDIIVFPEMVLTGYLPEHEMPELAESLDGDSVSRIRECAQQHSIAVAFGYPELADDKNTRYNSFVLADESGQIAGVYRKIHLWDTEALWAKPGSEVLIARVAGVVMSGWICYDTRFPEMGRLAYLRGAELCLVPTAWLGPGDEWLLATRARAVDNMFFVAGSDLINRVPGLECAGHSVIVDPKGHILAQAEAGSDVVIDAKLDPAIMESQRSRLPLLRDRKPELYGDLVSKGRATA